MEISSDSIIVEEIFELWNTTNSRCFGVPSEAQGHGKKIGSIRGRQATVDALIDNEHYPTISCLRTLSDWLRKLSQRTLIGYKNIRRLGLHEQESKRFTDGLTYTDDSISGYASSRQVATKLYVFYCTFEQLFWFLLLLKCGKICYKAANIGQSWRTSPS